MSELPDDLLIDILSLLPVKGGVRTSLLSKRWKHLWKHIHSIYFRAENYFGMSVPFECLDQFISSTDQSRIIKKFNVQFLCQMYDVKIHYNRVDSWMNWAVNHSVEMIGLDIHIDGARETLYEVPTVLFHFQSLVELELSNSTLNMLQYSVSWPLLNVLLSRV